MLTQDQNTIVYLMFLNGILFLGLNFIAHSIVFPGPKGSKRIGYALIVAVILAFGVQMEYRSLIHLNFAPEKSQQILLFGFAFPVFLISIVYYRIKKNRLEKSNRPQKSPSEEKHGPHRS